MEQKIFQDGLKVVVDTTELEKAIEVANLLIDKIKEANALLKELARLSDSLDFKISVTGKPADFAYRLKQALNIRNIKQSELSSRTKIPKSAISQYISGSFKPKQDRIELIADALDVSVAWLMGFDVVMESNSDDGF